MIGSTSYRSMKSGGERRSGESSDGASVGNKYDARDSFRIRYSWNTGY